MVEFEHANFNDLLEEPSNENNEVEEVVDEEPLLPDQESDGITQEPESTEQPTSEQEAQTDEGDDVLTSYLKSRGIKNNRFMLVLLDPDLAQIDPHDPNLSFLMKQKACSISLTIIFNIMYPW